METETRHRAGPIHQRGPTRARPAQAVPPARAWVCQAGPAVRERETGARRTARSGELKLVGEEPARKTEPTHAFPVTRRFASCK
jgi:hypothetical protein